MTLPRISVLMQMTEAAMRLQIAQNRPATVEELRGVADLLRYFAASADEMECRLAGETTIQIPLGGNVVSLAAFATKPKQPQN